MITGLIGSKVINCCDYSKDDLKRWAEKEIILCPICLKPYEYCHGLLNRPYFRHKDKTECEYLYYEPESEEHINGKTALYEWVKKQTGVSDAVIEGWLPETKQRPDIMFTFNNHRYVIEYQCTPISTEYYERHNLYQAAGINDIWICGTEKYQDYSLKRKAIEEESVGCFNSTTKIFKNLKRCIDKNKLPYNDTFPPMSLPNINLDDCIFNNSIFVNDVLMECYIQNDIRLHNKLEALKVQDDKRKFISDNIIKQLNRLADHYSVVSHNCKFSYKDTYSKKYLVMFNFSSDITDTVTMFIKSNCVDVCYRDKYRYYLIESIPISNINSSDEIFNVVYKYIVKLMQSGIKKFWNSEVKH